MAEYIEREELKKVLSNEAVHCLTFRKTGEARGLIKAKEIISKLPSADLVEVVRCGQCGHYCKNTGECNLYGRHPNEKDFCSSGVLKEREG